MDLRGKTVLSNITPLQQLLEDINFQRTKELRNQMKDDSGFVMLTQGNTQWTEMFVRHFLFHTKKESIDSDDLLFFVRKKFQRGSNRNAPKFDTEIEVFRKDSKKLPIGDPDVDWEETVYLNLVIHQFDYFLTLAICTRTSPKELQVLKRHSQRVYASPSCRKMDSKGESEEITFPHICFMVDNFDEVFSDILVRDGEMVCVELVAKDHEAGSIQGVIFLGSIRYDALKKVYDARQSSLSSKMAQRMTFGLFNTAPQTRAEFVRMKGPAGKGFAEMAVTKPKGSGIETPTSEPGFCMTDMWDSECEEEIDEYYNTRHQRRLSDPSSNLNNFSKNAWRQKQPNQPGYGKDKAMSQNEGLDSLANEIYEIEAGDVRDDRPASSASDTKLTSKRLGDLKSPSSACCVCFPTTPTSARNSVQLSEVYCPTCADISIDSPSCLTAITRNKPPEQVRTLLNVESEIEYSKNFNKKLVIKKSPMKTSSKSKEKKKVDQDEYEIACEAGDETSEKFMTDEGQVKIGKMTERDKKLMIRVSSSEVFGREESPIVQNSKGSPRKPSTLILNKSSDVKKSPKKPKYRLGLFSCKNKTLESTSVANNNQQAADKQPETGNESDGNNNSDSKLDGQIKYSTLPLVNRHKHKRTIAIPQRTTSDGTQISYLCDLPKKLRKELDDGQYNPLWTSKGNTQTFHFWKENRRQTSVPLNAFLTYISLPWFAIAKDLLDHREMPILTF